MSVFKASKRHRSLRAITSYTERASGGGLRPLWTVRRTRPALRLVGGRGRGGFAVVRHQIDHLVSLPFVVAKLGPRAATTCGCALLASATLPQ